MSNTSNAKKKLRPRMYIKLHGQPLEVDETYTKESALLRGMYEGKYHGQITLKIKSSILEKALEFCKKRGEINLEDKLKDFDSDFLKQIKQSDDADAIIFYLIDAACKLEIDELLMDDAIESFSHKTPEEIKKFLYVHYNEGDDCLFDYMKNLMGYARWGLSSSCS